MAIADLLIPDLDVYAQLRIFYDLVKDDIMTGGDYLTCKISIPPSKQNQVGV